MLEINTIHQGDCLEVMGQIEDKSIDLILSDLPYGITSNKWDSVIPLDKLWVGYKRIIKNMGIIVLTGSQPFSSRLVSSNFDMFKHEWIWIKNRGSNFANTVREPMKEHESILVFANKKWTYNKQMQERTGGGKDRAKYLVEHNSQIREGTRQFEGRKHHQISHLRVPSSWQKFNVEVGLHPTQKPIKLFEYLIKTYSNEDDLVFDGCVGSGTTAVSSKKLNRNFICSDISKKYVDIAKQRLKEVKVDIPPTPKGVGIQSTFL